MFPHRHFNSVAPLASAVAVAVASACGNATVSTSTSGNTDGVSPTKIVVGSLSSQSGPISADFAPIIQGVQAYFDMTNAHGGVNGRKLDLAYTLDDASDPSQDVDQARALVDQYHVFAVVGVATPSFSGGPYLASHNVPTFGYAVQTQWTAGPSLFGTTGSYVSFDSPQPEVAFVAGQVRVASTAVIAYNISQSSQACQGIVSTLKQFGFQVGFQDLSISPPAVDLSADVSHIKSSGATFVASCLDVNGNIRLAQNLQQAGVTGLTQYWLDGYDQGYLDEYSTLMQGVYFYLSHVPFEAPQYHPGAYTGMETYLATMRKYAPQYVEKEVALQGWIAANQFVTGLRSLGRNVSRTRLVNAINRERDFTAGGIIPVVDWTHGGHDFAATPICAAFVQVQGNKFVPIFGSGGSVFTCFGWPYPSVTTPTTIALQPGTSG